jgi:hypothetical protein
VSGSLAAIELERHDWASFRVADGRPLDVPEYLRGLISSTTTDDAEAHYWGLENEVVVQGRLFNSAVPVVPVILAALTEPMSRPARVWLLELLFQIVNGESHETEVEHGNPDLGERCREHARQGMWVLYRELHQGDARAARVVLDVLAPADERTHDILRARNVSG